MARGGRVGRPDHRNEGTRGVGLLGSSVRSTFKSGRYFFLYVFFSFSLTRFRAFPLLRWGIVEDFGREDVAQTSLEDLVGVFDAKDRRGFLGTVSDAEDGRLALGIARNRLVPMQLLTAEQR